MKMNFTIKRRLRNLAAFSLVEVVLALGLTTFCMTTLLAMIPVGLQSSNGSNSRMSALNLCTALEAELRSARTDAAAASKLLKDLDITIPKSGGNPVEVTFYDVAGESGTGFDTRRSASSRYRFQVKLTPPQAVNDPGPAMAHLKVSWPAGAAAQHALGNAEMVIVLDRP